MILQFHHASLPVIINLKNFDVIPGVKDSKFGTYVSALCKCYQQVHRILQSLTRFILDVNNTAYGRMLQLACGWDT